MTNSNVGTMKTGYAQRRKIADIAIYIILSVMVVIWLFPIFWLVARSFDTDKIVAADHIIPKSWTLDNYIGLFSEESEYGTWLLNTLIVAVCSCVVSTLIILMISYAFSRLRFKSRKTFLNLGLILGMFPGFMSMTATYAIMSLFGLNKSLVGLIIVYAAGAGLGYQVSKGFFDTIPRSLDEAAKIDGATKNQIFWRIILPLSKPIVVYTALTTFLSPWGDYIFVNYFMKDETENWTIALGLYNMVVGNNITEQFTTFCAGAVLIAIPITILFIVMQRFYVAGVTGGAVKG